MTTCTLGVIEGPSFPTRERVSVGGVVTGGSLGGTGIGGSGKGAGAFMSTVLLDGPAPEDGITYGFGFPTQGSL